MTPADITKAIQNNPTLQWRGADNATHVLSRQGYEIGRFVSREARDLAVGAVNGAAELLSRIASLELDLEAARKQLQSAHQGNEWLAREGADLLDALADVASQHYEDESYVVRTGGLSTAETVCALLVKHGRLKQEDGRFEWVDPKA